MPDLTQLLRGKSNLLTDISEFVAESGDIVYWRLLLVWRVLSSANRAIGDAAVQAHQTANFAGCGNLTDAAAEHLARCPQLQTVNFALGRNLTDAAAQHLARCRGLQTVDFRFCGNLTDAAAQRLAQCPQLQTVNFAGCRNLTDAAAQQLRQRRPLLSVYI